MSRNYFIFEENRCIGCEACVVACLLENGDQLPNKWRTIFTSNKKNTPGVPVLNLSMACNHCDEAPCMKYCPALAYSRDPQTNAVLVNSDNCIGCSYCIWNCPYEVPKISSKTSTIEKCNFCNSRLLDNIIPACSMGCPTGALSFSFQELNDSSNPFKLRENPSPSLKLLKNRDQKAPQMDHSLHNIKNDSREKTKQSDVNAAKELPLLIFTIVVSLMVPVSASGILSYASDEIKLAFILSGLISAVISLFHLGKMSLFWRSILNFNKSPLSREIVFFSLYMATTITDLFVYNIPDIIIAISGLATLVSIDMIYKPLQWNWKTQWHMGQVLLISTSFFLLLNQLYFILVAIIFIRLIIGTLLNTYNRSRILSLTWFVFMILVLIQIYYEGQLWLILLTYCIGELLSRIIFYNDLETHKIANKLQHIKM